MLLDSETTQFYEEHIRLHGYSYRALGFGRRRALAVATGLVAGLMVLTAAGQWLSLASFYT